MRGTRNPQVGIALPDAAFRAVRRLADERGCAMATICKEGVIKWLRSEGHIPPLQIEPAPEAEALAS